MVLWLHADFSKYSAYVNWNLLIVIKCEYEYIWNSCRNKSICTICLEISGENHMVQWYGNGFCADLYVSMEQFKNKRTRKKPVLAESKSIKTQLVFFSSKIFFHGKNLIRKLCWSKWIANES